MLGIVGFSLLARASRRRCAVPERSRAPRTSITLRRYSMLLVALGAAACASGASDDNGQLPANQTANADDPSSGSMRGTVVLHVASFDDGTGDREYYLRTAKGDTRLYF